MVIWLVDEKICIYTLTDMNLITHNHCKSNTDYIESSQKGISFHLPKIYKSLYINKNNFLQKKYYVIQSAILIRWPISRSKCITDVSKWPRVFIICCFYDTSTLPFMSNSLYKILKIKRSSVFSEVAPPRWWYSDT